MTNISLAARHLVKRYGGVTALADGNLEVQSGEVVALLGANGSGKSTLSKIITGVVAPDEGQLLLDGRAVRFSSPQVARKEGIAAVYQELSLVPDMTVAENIWLAHEPLLGSSVVRRSEVRNQTQNLLNFFAGTVRPSLRPDTFVSSLPPDEKQIVEILKALSLQPRLIILDEATASLDARQVNRLFELIQQWKEQNMAIVFVSHRMEEIFRIADRATVLRSGKTVATTPLSETNERALVEYMVEGGAVSRYIKNREQEASGAPRLTVEHMNTTLLRDVSFSVRDGELLGLGGLRGQGQSDILLALFGAIPFTGQVALAGRPVHFTHPRQAMRAEMAYVPGDRNTEGLLPTRPILENMLLPSWQRYGTPLRMPQARKDATTMAQRLNLVMSTLDAPTSSLSGGNAQKVVLGKWLLRAPKLLLLDDPTKGVDVGAKEELYALLGQLREVGTAIILYSSEDEELLGLSDRVLVLHDGRIQTELTDVRLTRSELVAASLGAGTKRMEP